MSKTIEVTAAAVANEATPVEVKHEAIDYTTANAALRREMAKVVFGKIIDNLSDDDLNKYVGVAADINTKYSAHLKHEVATHEPTPTAMPADVADYNYDELEAQATADAAVEPLRVAAAERIGFKWVKGGGVAGNLLAFKTSLNARREAKLAEKTAGMSDEERAAYIAKWEKRSEQISKASAFAVASVLTVWTFKSGIDHLAPMLLGGGDTGAKNMAMDAFNSTDNKGANHDYTLANSEKTDLTDFDKAVLSHYNNSDSSFYDFSHKQFRGDFGPALQASAKDGTMPAGFGDWMSRHQHEPNGLANLVSGLKLDGHGDSMADRNALADIYDNDKMAQVKADIMVQNELRNGDKFSIKIIDLKSYNSTLMVDHNGDPVISMKNNIHLGGTAYEITNKETGEKTYWRRECGGDQQVWPIEEAPVQNYQSSYVAPAAPEKPVIAPQAPTKPIIPTTPGIPRIPETPTTPIIPGVPPIPETPVVPAPKSSNPLDYQAPGRDDTTDGGTGVKPRVDSGAFTPPPIVEQLREALQPGRGAGNQAPADSSMNLPQSETGGKRAGGNSNPDSGVGKAGKPQSTGGATSSGDPGGPAV